MINIFNDNSVSYSLNKEFTSLLPSYNIKISSSFEQEILEEKEDINFVEIQNKNNIDSLTNNNYNSFSFLNLNTENIEETYIIKNDATDKSSTKSNILNEYSKRIDLINEEFQIKITSNISNKKYRKDGYYKHFKVIFGKYLKNKVNKLKNLCFPEYNSNNFSTPSYKYIGNPKEKDNYNYLFYKVKDILIYGKDQTKHNRQYNNELIINYIEKNEKKAKDKIAYEKLILFLNNSVKEAFISFYNDKNQLEIINKDKICIFFDDYFKKNTGISLLEKNGFIKAMKRKNE